MNLQEYNLRVGDVAYQLKVTPMTVIRWADKGDLYCVKVGASRRFRQEDIDDFLKSKQNQQKLKEPERPVYVPSADQCGFDTKEDEERRQKENKEQVEKLRVLLVDNPDMKAFPTVTKVQEQPVTPSATTPVKIDHNSMAVVFPSGFRKV